jgi:hypothetical protein
MGPSGSEVRSAEARVEKVTEALARIGYSEPLAAKLRVEEARLLDARKAARRDGPCGEALVPAALLLPGGGPGA